jgi:RNA polymerase sigma-70 factor, ECF subfamily
MLRAMFDAGRAAWPPVQLEAHDFVVFVAERSDGALPSATYAADLYLACACARRAPGASDTFYRSFAGEIERAAARVETSAAFVHEIRQAVHERLLVGKAGGAGKIAEYSGRAALGTWVHVVATRLALNLRLKERDRTREVKSDGAAPPASPELEYLKRRYKSEFERALRAAVGHLSAEDRDVLRRHLVDSRTVDQLGEALGVGRSTAARRLSAARAALVARTHDELRGRLKLSRSELESLGGLVQSRIDLSLAGLLRAARA